MTDCLECFEGAEFFDDLSCNQVKCGNGLLNSYEICDDNNTLNGDGCSANCTIPNGFYC